jgi:hypothetical protein
MQKRRGGKYSGPWQKEKREGRKRGKERKEGKGKKEKKEKERKKKNRKKERVTAPISSHFIQGQTLVPPK